MISTITSPPHFLQMASDRARLRGLPAQRREDSFLYADEALGKAYWAHHNAAANYAVANRHVIADGVREALEQVFGVDGEVYYEKGME